MDDLSRLRAQFERLHEHEKDAEAILVGEEALALAKSKFGLNHADVAEWFNDLAAVYGRNHRQAEAEQLFKQAIESYKKALGKNHTNVGLSLNNLAWLYHQRMKRYAEAEPLYQQAIAIGKKALGKNDFHVARYLENLAWLYKDEGRYAEAERLFREVLAIRKKVPGKNDADLADSLRSLATLYEVMSRYVEAEPLYKRALAIRKKAFCKTHPQVANSLSDLAGIYVRMKRYAEAEPLYEDRLEIYEKEFGKTHPNVAAALSDLAGVYVYMKHYADAEPLYKRALEISENERGKNNTYLATALNNLAVSYEEMKHYAEAETLYKRAGAIFVEALGKKHPNFRAIFGNLARVNRKMGRPDVATIFERAIAAEPEPGTRELTTFFVTNREALTDQTTLSFGSARSRNLSFGQAMIVLTSEELRRLAKRRAEGLGWLHQASGTLTTSEKLKIRHRCQHQLSTSSDLMAAVAAAIQRSSLYKTQVLIFVHGYNVGFEGALLRAAQIGFDLEFDGALITFAWPSAKSLWGYGWDRVSADIAVNHLLTLLDEFAKQLPTTKIHLIAHSMGNLVVLGALEKIAVSVVRGAEPKINLGEVVLAHPDVDRQRFEQLADAVKPLGVGLTLYVNTNDWALWASSLLPGMGRAGGEVLVVPGVDTIDTSGIGRPWSWRSLNPFNWSLNHDVFVRDPIVFGEITRLLLTSKRPVHERTFEFRPVESANGTYWKFKPTSLASAI